MATKKNTKKAAPKKKAVAKKAPAKKKPAAKKPAPKKKVVAKKPVKKAAPKKVVAKKPVKKAAPKKKVVAKKPVKKVAPKKAAPKKKVEAKKPVKKTPAKKVETKKTVKAVVKKTPVVKAKKEIKKVEKPAKAKVEKPVKVKAEKPAKVEKPKKEEKQPEMRMASKPNTPKKVVRSDKQSPFYKQPDIKALASINPAFKIHNARPNVIKPAVAKVKDTRSRYSDAELQEFKEIILKKLEEAKKDLEMLRGSLSHTDDHGTDDTSPTFKMMEDGSETLSREETAQLAGRQEKFIMALDNALIRIENKTYGVCRVTGNLISKERLKLVPHTTLSIEAKNMQD